MKNILKYLLTGLLLLAIQVNTEAQSSKEAKKAKEVEVIQNAIDGKNYTFRAQSMVPMTGITRQLNGVYDLTISDNEITSFLPYMGRIYMPLLDPMEGPLRFTSKDFTYSASEDRKKGWTISIKPKDVRSVREFTLNVQDNGNATLQVTGNDRQPVTFYGYIETA
ncbi:MAG: DUF4251 domain-containing protein [Sphingobacteriales bacterium]|nr:DUF4251 domain-containing protein [Sphingobacteriales bacterium]OJY80822.1 MAG: hypothetical protein BGP14_01075 [Sphingobacteriales bacterium 44-15]